MLGKIHFNSCNNLQIIAFRKHLKNPKFELALIIKMLITNEGI